MLGPSTHGPQEGDWRQGYMTALHRLKLEVNRELDRAQVGAAVPEGDPLQTSFDAALAARET